LRAVLMLSSSLTFKQIAVIPAKHIINSFFASSKGQSDKRWIEEQFRTSSPKL